MEKLTWHQESRKIKDLKPLEKNPFGKIKKEGIKRLQEKIDRLGVFEIPTIDLDNSLLSFNKRHHALMKLGRGEEEIDVRVPNRPLTQQERKEIIINSNVHEGEWDEEILKADFSDIDLTGIDVNFNLNDVKFEDEDSIEPEYPIVAKYSEKYDAVVIVVDNEIDRNCLFTMLGLDVEKCYKTSRVGTSQVINFKRFLEKWNTSK